MITQKIPFNKPYITGNEINYITQAVDSGKISGNGLYTKKCQQFFEQRYSFQKCLLTTSCTDALEMCAILINIKAGDEVIVPSYTFVSSALAFVRQGAKVVFCDSRTDHPGMDEKHLEPLINNNTKAIIAVHYAGVACEMERLLNLCNKYNLYLIEDAAQAVDSYYKNQPLGSIGHLACFSFHETKNLQCGEGGMLVLNNPDFNKRAEIIWEKGTNRAEFFRGEIDKYGWIDVGSSFLPSEITSAFLFAQLEQIDQIQNMRKEIWMLYYTSLCDLEKESYIKLPNIPEYAKNNAHMFYIICRTLEERSRLIMFLKENNISAVFHYISLHRSPYYQERHAPVSLPNSEYYSDCLLRLPMYNNLSKESVLRIADLIKKFFKS